jgi:hypothetical protein
MKIERLKTIQFNKMIKNITFNMIQIITLFLICYSINNDCSFVYKNSLQNTFNNLSMVIFILFFYSFYN